MGQGGLSRNHGDPFDIPRITKKVFYFHDFSNTPDNMTTACQKRVKMIQMKRKANVLII